MGVSMQLVETEQNAAATEIVAHNAELRAESNNVRVYLPKKNVGMLAGDGVESYAKNSASQGNAVQTLFPLLFGALDQVELPTQGPLVIADLGCAAGPNCLKNVNAIVDKLKERFADAKLSAPEFQLFFQDLPANDFNNLFRLIAEDNGYDTADSSPSKYYAAGVSGSFYDRLFPRASVHVFFSSYSLHWLSAVPEAVLDKHSPAYNKGKSWVQNGRAEVAAAYKEQGARDLRNFLSARAEELVPGGLVFLLFMGRGNPDPVKVLEGGELPKELWNMVDTVWDKLVEEGSMSEELRDCFNFASYLRSMEEVKEVVESFSSEFRVEKMEALPIYHFAEYLARFSSAKESPVSFGKKVLLMFKATTAPVIEAHIGPELSALFWQKYSEVFFSSDAVDTFYSRITNPGKPSVQYLVSLVRR